MFDLDTLKELYKNKYLKELNNEIKNLICVLNKIKGDEGK